ncbi:MAG: four helix bundle protein, partial [Anaerolineae bacterium]
MRRGGRSCSSQIFRCPQSRQHGAEFRQFLYIALGSTAEVDTQIVIAEQLGYITKAEHDAIYQQLC